MPRGGTRKDANGVIVSKKPKIKDKREPLTVRLKGSIKARATKKAGRGKVGRYVEALIVADLDRVVIDPLPVESGTNLSAALSLIVADLGEYEPNVEVRGEDGAAG